ncbi:hypothetical protein ACQRIT_003152 [Beauveria bassiana]
MSHKSAIIVARLGERRAENIFLRIFQSTSLAVYFEPGDCPGLKIRHAFRRLLVISEVLKRLRHQGGFQDDFRK